MISKRLSGWLWRHVAAPIFVTKRAPDVTIGEDENPYLRRWWIIPRNPVLNVYLHEIRRSDDDEALHSHPYLWNLSILLLGRYREITQRGETTHGVGTVKFRFGPSFHRLEVDKGWWCWTLFITGPRVFPWGFACPQGFVHWKKFTAKLPGGVSVVGAGCGES